MKPGIKHTAGLLLLQAALAVGIVAPLPNDHEPVPSGPTSVQVYEQGVALQVEAVPLKVTALPVCGPDGE